MATNTKTLLKDKLKDLVETYKQGLSQFQIPTYNEAQLRVDFIDLFLEILGWDVNNTKGLPQHLREVEYEAKVAVNVNGKNQKKKPDYSFKIGTEKFFFLETKRPSVNISVDKKPSFQLRRYGWSGNLKISVLTNFTDLFIYDCSVRPVVGDDIDVALVAHYHYTEYVDYFDEIWEFLSRDAVTSGIFDKKFSNIVSPLRKEPFDKYFLDQIKKWRKQLGDDILKNNLGVDTETINIFVQRILNRIIFLRICEDRNLEKYKSLKMITTYDDLKNLFIVSDRKYDSGLFTLLDEDNLIISDNVLIKIFRDLYYPNNSYEFGVVDPYIIGQIYELFLGEKLEIQNNGVLTVTIKPEMIDTKGAVNTPKNITDIIVTETLSPLFKGKAPHATKEYRIGDICCGSGNFLLSAFEFIINYYVEYFQKNNLNVAVKRGYIYQNPGSSNYTLSYEIKRMILKNMIFGVDIDPLAVEVTKFSLLLKVLEGTTEDELNAYCKRTNERILPNMDENVKLGNSLVDFSFAKYYPAVYKDQDLMSRINMFDWQTEFGGRKFDAIVGNPPYIRVQKMAKYSPEEHTYYKDKVYGYQTAQVGATDKYYLFIERALNLLNDRGILGYIIPHKFMNVKSGAGLRELLSKDSHVKKIYHFGTNQLFKKLHTYTCILILSKSSVDNFEISFVKDLNQFIYDRTCTCQTFPSKYLSRQPWLFMSQDLINQLAITEDKCMPLSTFANVFTGLQTSADNIYIFQPDREDKNYVYGHDNDNKKFKIEKGILRRAVYDAQLTSYEKIVPNSVMIFPYKSDNGQPVLYTPTEMKALFPYALEYLKKHKNELDQRSVSGKKYPDGWYAYGRSQNIKKFLNVNEHLVWSTLTLNSNYVYDNESILFTGGGNGPFYLLEMKPDSKVSILYIQAILNHQLMENVVKSMASTFGGNYASHSRQFLDSLPIYNIDFNDSKEVAIHDQIVDKVKLIMKLKSNASVAPNNAKRKIIESAISSANQDLNNIIDQLYQVPNP